MEKGQRFVLKNPLKMFLFFHFLDMVVLCAKYKLFVTIAI